MRRRALGSIALLAILGGCASAPATTPSPSTSLSPVVVPTASSAASPSVSPSPAPSEATVTPPSSSASAPPVGSLAWRQIGAASGGELAGSAAGYVALGGSTGVEFSKDGASWAAEKLPFAGGKDHGIVLGMDPQGVASNDHLFVVVGGYGHAPCTPSGGSTGGGPECPSYPISWVSTDGHAWRSSYPWPGPHAPKGFSQGNLFTNVWAVPSGGFDAAEAYVAGEDDVAGRIFHSSDGLAWTALPASPPTALKGSQPAETWHLGLADGQGRRVIGSYWYPSGGSVARLFTSADGSTWTLIDSFPGNDASVEAGVPPDPARAAVWMIAGTNASSLPTIWTSPDLGAWTPIRLPVAAPNTQGAVTGLAETSAGYVAVGQVSSPDAAAATHSSWMSADGVTWTQLPTPGTPGDDGPDYVSDGPAGPLGFAAYNGAETPPGVWALRGP
jgi:hypothetical protein